ncbi:MAG: OmpA family protein [Acidobacteriota bacterium]
MRNLTVPLIVLAAFLALAGFFAWRHIDSMNERIAQMGETLVELEERAQSAERRASEAEEMARDAEDNAGLAADRAAEAAEREKESAELALQAEESEREALLARQQAERQAEAASMARAEAEERSAQAEIQLDETRVELSAAREETEKARQETRRTQAEVAKIRRKMERELDRMQSSLGRIAETRRTALGLVMTLDSGAVEFDFNRAELRPKNRELLSRVAGVLLTFNDFGIQIFGHTDDVGDADYNQKLSERRAEAVRAYLIEAGVAPEAMTTLGLGKSSPLVDGTDSKARQRNRRVELAIVFSEGEYEAVQSAEGEEPGLQG